MQVPGFKEERLRQEAANGGKAVYLEVPGLKVNTDQAAEKGLEVGQHWWG